MNFVYQMLKNRVPVSQKTPFISITKTNQLKLFREIISLFWDSYKTRKNFCGQRAEFWQCQSKWCTKLPLCFRGLKDISKQKIEQQCASLCLYVFLKNQMLLECPTFFLYLMSFTYQSHAFQHLYSWCHPQCLLA